MLAPVAAPGTSGRVEKRPEEAVAARRGLLGGIAKKIGQAGVGGRPQVTGAS